MDRPPNPTPINPYAKYLSNSISNVLYCIHKFDQGTLAWPTGPRKRNVWTKQMSGSPSGVPLAGTGSSVIPNSRHSRSKHNEGVDKKNAFYQILQASQDQPSCGKSAGRSRIETKREFNLDNDGTYNDIYDIVKTHLQCKCYPKAEYNQLQRPVTPKVSPPVIEIYTVRPRGTETTTQQKPSKGKKSKGKPLKAKYPIVESKKLREKTNEKRTHKGEPPKSVSKPQHSKKELFQIWPQINKRREQPRKDIDKAQTTLPETNISKETTEHQHYSQTARIPILKQNSKLQNNPPKPKETIQRKQKPLAEQLPIKDSSSKVFSKKPGLKPPTFIPEFPSEENYKKLTRPREEDIEQNNVKEWSAKKPTGSEELSLRHSTLNPIGNSTLKEVFQILERPNENKPEEAIIKPKPPKFISKFPTVANYKKLTREREKDVPQKNVKEDKVRKPTGLKQEVKAEPASATKIRKQRIFKAQSTEKYSKASRHRFQSPKVDQKPSVAAFTPAIENSFIASELIRDAFELPPEIDNFWSTRPSLNQRRLRGSVASRKTSMASTDTYQEKLRKLKQYLNKPSSENTENNSLDLEGIHDRDLLLYPYNDIFKMDTMTEVKDTGVENKLNKPRSKQKPPKIKVRPPKMEKVCQEVLKNKSACCICRTIRCPGKDAPFLEEMKKAQRRQELLAYRANMAMWNKPSKGSNRARQLDKKLYSLEDRYIVFTRKRKLNMCPKKSNSTIFPTPSKRKTFLKRCNSFIFPKESSSITCS